MPWAIFGVGEGAQQPTGPALRPTRSSGKGGGKNRHDAQPFSKRGFPVRIQGGEEAAITVLPEGKDRTKKERDCKRGTLY